MRATCEQLLGCIVGGAIGDAFGAGYEGRRPPFCVDSSIAWMLTDDTYLTLATCDAIVNRGEVDPAEIADAYASLFRSRSVPGIGASTFKALSDLAAGAHWALAGCKGDRAAGNGAAMRIAPLAFYVDPATTIGRQQVRDVSRITHHNDEAYAGALAVVIAVKAAWSGSWRDTSNPIGKLAERIPDSNVRDRIIEIAREPKAATLPDLAARYGSSGYVVESVPLALCAAERMCEYGFEATMHDIVMCGGDVDTIASIAGQIAGASVGYSHLPESMVCRLPQREWIMNTAARFANAVAVH